MKRNKLIGLMAVMLVIVWGLTIAPTLSFAQQAVSPCTRNTGGGCTPVSAAHPLPVDATVSASVSGFAVTGAYGTLTATASSSASTAIPTTGSPTALRMTNTSTAAVSCVMVTGAATATTNKILIEPLSSVVRGIGSFDHVACINMTGSASNVVVLEGGTGLGNDSGGGGSSGGGGGGGTSSNFTEAFPSAGTAIGASNGGNMVALAADSSSRLLVAGAGTAGSAGGGVLTVQGVSSMTPVQVSQATAASLNATIVGTGTFATQAAQSGTWNITNISGTVSLPTGAATLAKQPALGTAGTASTDVITVQGIASMTPFFVSSGTAPVVSMNSASANSGLNAAVAGVFDDAAPTSITENSFGFIRMSANRNVYGTIRDAAGNERGANVNASNQLAIAGPVTVASAGIASGAIASGAVASGAYATGAYASGSIGSGAVASGAYASGALASGSIAAGAQVDLLTMRGTKAAGTAAANSILAGGIYNSGGVTLTDGQQAAVQMNTAGSLNVNVTAATGLAQGSTTSGQTGSLVMGAASTSAPTTTNANTYPLSMNTVGGLRLDTLTGGVGATGSAAPANAGYMAGNGSGATGGLLAGLKTCDLHAKYDASDNGKKTLVTGVSGRKVYVCGFILATGSTATNLNLAEGSDADCATNSAALTPAYQLVANDKIGMQAAFWTGLVVSTNAYYVCVQASAGNAHQAEIWYTIQ